MILQNAVAELRPRELALLAKGGAGYDDLGLAARRLDSPNAIEVI